MNESDSVFRERWAPLAGVLDEVGREAIRLKARCKEVRLVLSNLEWVKNYETPKTPNSFESWQEAWFKQFDKLTESIDHSENLFFELSAKVDSSSSDIEEFFNFPDVPTYLLRDLRDRRERVAAVWESCVEETSKTLAQVGEMLPELSGHHKVVVEQMAAQQNNQPWGQTREPDKSTRQKDWLQSDVFLALSSVVCLVASIALFALGWNSVSESEIGDGNNAFIALWVLSFVFLVLFVVLVPKPNLGPGSSSSLYLHVNSPACQCGDCVVQQAQPSSANWGAIFEVQQRQRELRAEVERDERERKEQDRVIKEQQFQEWKRKEDEAARAASDAFWRPNQQPIYRPEWPPVGSRSSAQPIHVPSNFYPKCPVCMSNDVARQASGMRVWFQCRRCGHQFS